MEVGDTESEIHARGLFPLASSYLLPHRSPDRLANSAGRHVGPAETDPRRNRGDLLDSPYPLSLVSTMRPMCWPDSIRS
jgi:hypothetical protein